MRWIDKKTKLMDFYHNRNSRIIEVYLFFPKKISGEWRWLEKAKIEQFVEKEYQSSKYSYVFKWFDFRWVD